MRFYRDMLQETPGFLTKLLTVPLGCNIPTITDLVQQEKWVSLGRGQVGAGMTRRAVEGLIRRGGEGARNSCGSLVCCSGLQRLGYACIIYRLGRRIGVETAYCSRTGSEGGGALLEIW